ncbi:MAG: hypothetical protein ABZF75_00445 [Columbia Basin potato purple top phytoplasma]
MEIHEEWYDNNNKCTMIKAKYTFDGLNGVGYYKQQLANKENIGSFELMKIQDSLKTQKEPSNLVCYIKDLYPFDLWKENSVNGFEYSSFDKKIDSQLFVYVDLEKQFKENSSGNCLIVKYEGPKDLIEKDKDYYLGRATCFQL